MLQCMTQTDSLILERVCSVIGDEDIDIAAKASTVLEMVRCLRAAASYNANSPYGFRSFQASPKAGFTSQCWTRSRKKCRAGMFSDISLH